MLASLYCSESAIDWPAEPLDSLRRSRQHLRCWRLRRARNYYLYLQATGGQARRLCDLSLDGGRALLGHAPAGVGVRLKNAMSRGLYPSFPCSEQRLLPLLRRIFPHLYAGTRQPEFRIYGNLAALERRFADFSLRDLLCQRHSSLGGEKVLLWRPLAMPAAESAHFLVPVLALSSLPLPLLLLRCGAATELPPSDTCSPLQFEALVQALAQTDKLLQQHNPGQKDRSGEPQLLKEAAAVYFQPQLEALRLKFLPRWQQDGIYLYWDFLRSAATYAETWQDFWQQGFFLPSNPYSPLVLPPNLWQNALSALL